MATNEVRERQKPLRVYLSPQERQLILARANECRLPPSTYLRRIGLGYQPKSSIDRDSVREMIKVNADQGRLGGLLKLWLVDKPGNGASIARVRSVLNQIESSQMLLSKLIAHQARRL